MVKIPVFEVEQWMDEYELTPGVLNIAETCACSVSISELSELSSSSAGDSSQPASSIIDFSRPMTYGAILGSDELRRNIAGLYSEEGIDNASVAPEDVIVTQGAIAANHLVFYSLVGPGDHAVCVYPTYQQLYTIPETLGAEVSLWKLKAEDGYVPDVSELEKLLKSNTKMIVINNPNNPTGATIPADILTKIIKIARERNIIVFSDEVYRPLFHGSPGPPSALSLGYEKVVVTSSMSKAWALAGIRVGWATSLDKDIIKRIAIARDYTAISVSQLDDQVARFALSDAVRPALLKRNMELAQTNLALLDTFVQDHADVCSWVKPTAGTTALVRFARGDGQPVDDVAFCKDVLDKTKVMFVPAGLCFGHERDFRGYVRIGYVSDTEVLRQALKNLSAYVAENLK
ncbi:PLP-dependent transferase [Xylaria bambusicola]|uniref:PLP-dependent transferase n=1 Tax=Xylaria bambusicola TaxID=326684 RepID=UPI0020073668|nr:PLP-dependent transferase [Xylaria bambusicola]KAI0512955.1 PLP-dependent transferase [Xylaria bambusicola]